MKSQQSGLIPFEEEDRRTREIVRDLHQPRAAVYWCDFVASSLTGWAAFGLAVSLPLFSWAMIGSSAIAVFALYRALCFLHEVSHLQSSRIPGFRTVFNLLAGYPLLMPTFVYIGVHQDHHGLSTYGTSRDPEYMPFAKSAFMTIAFALQSFLIPVALLVRFLALAPAGLLHPPLHRWLIRHASALTMNVQYQRSESPELAAGIRNHTLAILTLWGSAIALAGMGLLPWRGFGFWIAITGLISFVNTMRTLGAHAYESSGSPLDRAGQLADSIDTPGGMLSGLWAPVGLRYHALHHYFPGLPYHNLAEAHRRLSASLPKEALFHRVTSPSLFHSLRRLLTRRPL